MVTNVRDLLVKIRIEYETSLRALSDLQQRVDLLRDNFRVTTDNINKFVDSVNNIEDSVNIALQKLAEFPEEIPISFGVQERVGAAVTTTAAAGEREPGAILDPTRMAIQIANMIPILTTLLPQFFRGGEGGIGGLQAGVPVEVTALITDYEPRPLVVDVLLNQSRLQAQLNQLRANIQIGGAAVQRGAAIPEMRQQPEDLAARIRQIVTQREPTARLPTAIFQALRQIGVRRVFREEVPRPLFLEAGRIRGGRVGFRRGISIEEAVRRLAEVTREQQIPQITRPQQIPQIPITPTIPAKPIAPAVIPPAAGIPTVPTLPSPIVIQIEGGLTTVELINQISDEIERRLRTRERVEFYG